MPTLLTLRAARGRFGILMRIYIIKQKAVLAERVITEQPSKTDSLTARRFGFAW